ncbi:MAG: sodium/proline symporter [Francisellaceae bacterium]|nr:sodium/proline symporter [Francisellaceae bacterium]
MELHTNWPAFMAFIIYLIIVMGVGIGSYIVTKNLSDYVLGGRSLGGAVAALSAGASDMSSWLLMGLPGAIYLSGLKQIWVSLGLLLGAYASWNLIAKPLRLYSEIAKDSLTIPAFFDNRFQVAPRSIRFISGSAIVLFFIFYIASGLYAGGLLLSQTFSIPYHQGLLLATGIIMLYTAIGGFLAVSWTDFFQGTLMLLCLLVVPILALKNGLSFELALSQLKLNKPHFLHLSQGLRLIDFISLFSWGLGYFGMPHILVRFMAVKSIKEIKLAKGICMSWMGLSLIGAVLVGVAGALQFHENSLPNHEMVFMALSNVVLSPWLVGIILAAILSSTMCAIDSQMLAASSALTEDFYHAIFKKNATQADLMQVGRITVAFIAMLAFAIAYFPHQSIMELVSFAWAGLGATFGPVMILSLFWSRMNHVGAIAGMLGGSITVILWKLISFSPFFQKFALHDFIILTQTVYEILPGFITSFLCAMGFTLISVKPNDYVINQFKEVKKLLSA